MNIRVISFLIIILVPLGWAQGQERDSRQSFRRRRDSQESSRYQRRDESERTRPQNTNEPQGAGQPRTEGPQAPGQPGISESEGVEQPSRGEPQDFRPQRRGEFQGSRQGRPDGSEGFRQQYGLILERNIFSRDRRPYVPREERSTFRPPPPPIETDYCLKGITREHNVLTAFVEQLSTGTIGRYTLNAQIARGTIKSITLDTVEYAMTEAPASSDPGPSQSGTDPNDPNAVAASGDPNAPAAPGTPDPVKVTQVRIGQTLQGLAPGSRASYGSFSAAPVSTSPSTSETPAEPAPLGDAESDILKRLMQRRQQELGN